MTTISPDSRLTSGGSYPVGAIRGRQVVNAGVSSSGDDDAVFVSHESFGSPDLIVRWIAGHLQFQLVQKLIVRRGRSGRRCAEIAYCLGDNVLAHDKPELADQREAK